MTGEKTEQPTEQRKRQARREGQVPRTPDLGSWGGLFLASMLLPMVARTLSGHVRELLIEVTTVIADPSPKRAMLVATTGARDAALTAAPICAGLMLLAIAAAAAQGGLRPATKLFKPDFKRLNPLPGIKRAFGGHAAWEAVKAVAKTAVIGIAMYTAIRGLVPGLLVLGPIALPALLDKITGTILGVVRAAAGAGLVLAAADYLVVRRRIGKQIRMTKQEVKEEHRRSEGDPHVKAAIRGKQMDMARKRMMSEVPKADVVVVNPTHVAVALRYDPAKGAPRVVAKGVGAVAAKIREKAEEHRVPMVRDVALARALYRDCDLGQEIPAEFYEAVARVLAFVMMLKAKGSAAGLHTSTRLP